MNSEENSQYRNVLIVDRSEVLPRVKRVRVKWVCPICGSTMGEPKGHNFYEDGESHFCHVWDNPCGHVAKYSDLVID